MNSPPDRPPSDRPLPERPGEPFVTLTFWQVGTARIPFALGRMALDRRPVRRAPGLRFAKLLGTSRGHSFAPRDADLHRWGLLTVWDLPADARRFETDGPTHRRWDALATEHLRLDLRPLSSRGTWSRRDPFAVRPRRPGVDTPDGPWTGPVAAITRARLRPGRARRFRRAVPEVALDLAQADGVLLATGIGEAPIGLQGTVSLWDCADSLEEFAYRRAPHAAVVRRTAAENWYAEELFARFGVLSVEGTFDGRHPLAG